MRRTRSTRAAKKTTVYAEKSSSSEEDEPKKKVPCFESSGDDEYMQTDEAKKIQSASDEDKVKQIKSSDDEDNVQTEQVKKIQSASDEDEVNKIQSSDDEDNMQTVQVKKIQSSDDEDNVQKHQVKRKLPSIQPSDDEEKKGNESSSSESDIESYLKRPDELNLNSTFFQSQQPKVSFSQIERTIFSEVKQLTDSESELEDDAFVEPDKESAASGPPRATFEQLTEFTKKIEEAKMHVEKYTAKKRAAEKKDDIGKLLTMGEKNAWDSPELVKRVTSALGDGPLRSSEFESLSDSEKEDWEEVQQTEQPAKRNIIPKEGVEITLRMPDTIRKKKGIDLLAAMKRRLNRIKKENQVYVHRVHLLCWVAHGNYVNSVLNKETVLALALSLLPSQQCYPEDRTDLKYLEQILTWYRKTVTNVTKVTPKNIPLDKNLMLQINKKQVQNSKMYVYIFICILRALGIQCRLVLSLQVEPLRPPASELHSLSNDKKAEKASTSGEQEKGKKGSNDETLSKKLKKVVSTKKKSTSPNKSEAATAKTTGKKVTSTKNVDTSKEQNRTIEEEVKNHQKSSKDAQKGKATTRSTRSGRNAALQKSVDTKESTRNKTAGIKDVEAVIVTSKSTRGKRLASGRTNHKDELKPARASEGKKIVETKRSRSKTSMDGDGSQKIKEAENDYSNVERGKKLEKEVEQKASRSKSKDAVGSGKIKESESEVINVKTKRATRSKKLENEDATLVSRGKKLEKQAEEKGSRSKSSESKKGDGSEKIEDGPKRVTKTRSAAARAKPAIGKKLDDYIATLENLEKVEQEQKNVKVTNSNSKAKVTKMTLDIPKINDDIELDRDAWRRSKSLSPSIPELKSKPFNVPEKSASSSKLDETNDTSEEDEVTEVKKGRAKKKTLKVYKMPIKRKSKSPEIPQVDGNVDSSTDYSDDETDSIPQLDGLDAPSTSKPSLKKLRDYKSPEESTTNRASRPKIRPIYKDEDSGEDFTSNTSKPSTSRKVNLSKLSGKSSGDSGPTPPKLKKPMDVRSDIVNLIKGRINEQRHEDKKKMGRRTGDDSDSDYAPMPIIKKKQSPDNKLIPKVKVKRRVQPTKDVDLKVFSSDNEASGGSPKKKSGVDIWIEVYLENEEKWISADVIKGQVHCVKEIYARASHPVSYILSWDNTNRVKDITKRYCSNWNTVTRKLRTDAKWWEQSLKPYIGKKNARDKEEDEDLARQQLDQPLPKAISEYKDHPLYVLRRHLLKFQAIYPPDAITLGFIRKEPVFARDCVYTLHSRDIWLKHAKVVKLEEKPYKIVKARPKYDRLSNMMINADQPLEIFGVWQVEDYVPPTAENGVVPRNAYGNVELFKPTMLPKGTVHLQLPGLNKVARKLNIDCASAVTGFDFHSGGSHPTFDGFVVCEEFVDTIVAAWYQEQEEAEKREQEKYEKRVFGNWKRLIKGLLIRERLKKRYDFKGELTVPIPKPPEKPEGKPKGPRFITKKKK